MEEKNTQAHEGFVICAQKLCLSVSIFLIKNITCSITSVVDYSKEEIEAG